MAFTGQSSALKLSFIMDFVLVLLGLIIVGSLSIHATQSVEGHDDICLLFIDRENQTLQPSSCTFSSISSGIVTLAAIVLSFMDYITWKRSENYKGKRASVAALILAPIMTLLSFCIAIVVVLGLRSSCDGSCKNNLRSSTLNGLYTGISCAGLSGLFFALYGMSEYVQYRRRHINGDKW